MAFGAEIINARLSEVCLPSTSLSAAATPGALTKLAYWLLHMGATLSISAYPTSVADDDMIT